MLRRRGRIAGVTVVSFVERQETRVLAVQTSRHLNVGLGHRKMHDGTTHRDNQRDLRECTRDRRIATLPILFNRVVDPLCEVGLDLDRRHGDAVDKEHEVKRFFGRRVVVNLLNDAKDVAAVALGNLLVAVVFRGAFAHLEAADAGNADRIPQESKRSMLTSEFLQSIEQNSLPVVRLLQKFKFLRVRRLEDVGRIKSAGTVVAEIVFGPAPP